MTPEFIFDGPKQAAITIALAHGAGAPMDSPFMTQLARAMGDRGHRVARFEFPYMAHRRDGAAKRPPDRGPVLAHTWRAVIHALSAEGLALGAKGLVIGGKSMGGRIASLVADEAGVGGLVCLGYPFQAPGRPLKPERVQHLAAMTTPTLILQGQRDPFGGPDLVGTLDLSPAIAVHWLGDGDHGFKPRKKSGRTETDNWQDAMEALHAFVSGLS